MTTQNFTEDQLKASLSQRLKNGEISKEQAKQAIAKFREGQREEGGLFSAIWEPSKAIGGAIAGQVAGGLGGLLQLATGGGLDAAADTVKGVQEGFAEATAPETEAGKKGLENVGQAMELGLDMARFPISGLGGLGALISGKDADEAAQTIKDIQEKGVGQTAGDTMYAKTGSPLASTVAFMMPELVMTAIPIAGQAKKASNFQKSLALSIKNSEAQPALARGIAELQRSIQSGEMTQALLRQSEQLIANSPPRIQKQLTQVVEDANLGIGKDTVVTRLGQIADEANTPMQEKELATYIINGSGRAKSDPKAHEAVKQGFDQGVIGAVKAASPEDQAFMKSMVDTMEQHKKISTVTTRPTDIPGNNLLNRVNHIKKVNQEAAGQLDAVAQSLKGETVDFSAPVNNFLKRLDDMGIKLDENFKPIYEGSDVEGLNAPINAINNIVKRMSSGEAGGMPDAYDIHRLKKYIDEQVTYGKTAEGLAGKTENVLKSLRRELDDILDSNFEAYNEVNTTYADTVNALDSLQTAVGGKIDLYGANADKAIGTTLRGLMSNNRGRVQLMNAVSDIEATTRKYGGEFNDNIQVQMLFADELDSVFGTTARTSLEGSQAKATAQGIANFATGETNTRNILAQTAVNLAEKARGINQENAFKAIRNLLE